MKFLILFLIIIFAQALETTTGFGSTVISLGLGVYLYPIKELIIVLVILGWLQCLYIVVRGFRHISWRILLTRILVFSGIGLPLGIWFFEHFGGSQLKFFFGAFIVIIAISQLYLFYRQKGELKPLPFIIGAIVLVMGGFIHGIFASGGPMIVYYSSREIKDKSSFRSTLSALWLVLNTVLLANYFIRGQIQAQTLEFTAILLPALLIGILIGEFLHYKVNERLFRFVVYIVLLFTGIVILIR